MIARVLEEMSPIWVDLARSLAGAMAPSCRDENGRKRSVNTKIITVFIFFIENKIENGNFRNGNDIGISETSEMKV